MQEYARRIVEDLKRNPEEHPKKDSYKGCKANHVTYSGVAGAFFRPKVSLFYVFFRRVKSTISSTTNQSERSATINRL